MKGIHKKLREKYPWYDTWHKHPKHELFHWIIFYLFSVLTVVVVFFNVRSGFGENKRGLQPGSSGNVIGRVSDRIIVGFKDNVAQNEKTALFAKNKLKERSKLDEIGVEVLYIESGDTPENAVMRLQNEGKIDFVEVDAIVAPSFVPNDPSYPNEWHLPKINSPTAWDRTTGTGVTIAILDSGVDPTHPDLAPNLVPGWNFSDNNSNTADVYGHGTEVAGVAAGIGNNNIELAGEAYGAKIMPVRISDLSGYTTYSAVATGVNYAANHGAKVINVSYQAGGSNAVQRAAKYAKSKGSLVVMSEGNTGAPSGYKNSANIISVSATDNYDVITGWSTYGKDVDVAAPGQAILTTTRGGGTDYFSGTSFSAPLTAGVLALIWSVNPNLTPDQVQQILFNSSVDLGAPGWDPSYGWGRIDAARAVGMSK